MNKHDRDEMLSREEKQQSKECPECGGIMQSALSTQYEMSGKEGDDYTTLIEVFECLDCDYWENA